MRALLALPLLVWSLLPPYSEVFPQGVVGVAFACLLLDFRLADARANKLGSGMPALLLSLALSPLGAPWVLAVTLVLRACLGILFFGERKEWLVKGLEANLALLLTAVAAPFLPVAMIWVVPFLLASTVITLGGTAWVRCRLALGELLWAAALLLSVERGPWMTLLVVAGLVAYHGWRGEEDLEPQKLADAFSRQMDQAEDTLRSTRKRHESQKEKLQDFVALQVLLDDFQGRALTDPSTEGVAKALVFSARDLDKEATGGVVAGAPPTLVTGTEGFDLVDFGPLPLELAPGKVLRSPDGRRVVFPLLPDILFLWKKEARAADRLRDEFMRHLLERASLILRIGAQQRELAELLQQRTRALEELARSQAQLVQSGKMAAVGQMAAGVAHELNSPLAAIYLQAQMGARRLNKSDLDGVRVSLQTCESASERARAIIKNLLSFSRLSDGRKAPAQLDALAEQALKLLDGHFERDKVSCAFEWAPIPPVEVNAQDLQHVVTNIAINAVDALGQRPSERQLRVSCRSEGESVVLELANNGPPIPPEHLERVFEPFFTTKEVGRGTGLGLSLSYQLIEALGGVLSVENRSGWVVFRISLPRAKNMA